MLTSIRNHLSGQALLVFLFALGITMASTAVADDDDASSFPKIDCGGPFDMLPPVVNCEAESSSIYLAVDDTYRGGFFNASASEGIAYDPKWHRVFVANNATQSVDVLRIKRSHRNPKKNTAPNELTLSKEFSIDVSNLIYDGSGKLGCDSFEAIPEDVAVSSNKLLAVVLAPLCITKENEEQESQNDPTSRGKVAFFRTNVGRNGKPIKVVEIGYTPNMATFTPDGRTLLVANEGEPTDSYQIDPPGLVSLIDLTKGVRRARATNIGFWKFNKDKDELIAKGVRIAGPCDFLDWTEGRIFTSCYDSEPKDFRTYHILPSADPDKEETIFPFTTSSEPPETTTVAYETTTVAKDIEPEHIAVSVDSRTAWVTLAENNAIAVVDIRRRRINDIYPFGWKDHSKKNNGLDPTDRSPRGINIDPWPIKGMYMPSQVATYSVHGKTYLVFGNEGTRRNYDAFGDEVRYEDADSFQIQFEDGPLPWLDDEISSSVKTFFEKNNVDRLRLKVSWVDGDTDGDGQLDTLFAFGGRSFSIRSVPSTDGYLRFGRRDDFKLKFDSGDDFEQITALACETLGPIPGEIDNGELEIEENCFNTPDDENSFDEDSDLRGPEPISVTTGKIGKRTYAFIGLERIGGIMVYDISGDPDDRKYQPRFQQYINNRDFAINPKNDCEEDEPESETCAMVGDLSAEDLVFVPAQQSPTGAPLLLVGNETSGSVTIFRIMEM